MIINNIVNFPFSLDRLLCCPTSNCKIFVIFLFCHIYGFIV